MVRKETCPICKGNKVVAVEHQSDAKEWRSCNACNGSGYRVRIVHGAGLPAGLTGRF
ncbi:MAG: hypothetical protein Q8M55_03570 [Actinomycetota bacterium]|nr:hypothetical protein [Actinomycetota bacterium]